jgi:hypothetical protein
MSDKRKTQNAQLLVAAAALGAGGLLAAPTAHAVENCTVPGEYLRLDMPENGGYTITLSTKNGAIGDSGLSLATPELGVYGKVVGGITGRNVDFTITWNDTKTNARFIGTVGQDGFASGTATGASVPINQWNPGPWRSTEPLNCAAEQGAAAKTATVNKATNIFNKPDGLGTEYLNAAGTPIFKPPGQVQLVAPDLCRNDWCHVVAPEVPGDAWIYIGDGFGTFP